MMNDTGEVRWSQKNDKSGRGRSRRGWRIELSEKVDYRNWVMNKEKTTNQKFSARP